MPDNMRADNALFPFHVDGLGWALCDGSSDRPLDYFRSYPALEVAAEELLHGRAYVDPHRIVGCRVVPIAH